jgi:hypothetical protein
MTSTTFNSFEAAYKSLCDNKWIHTEWKADVGPKPTKRDASEQDKDLRDFARIARFLCSTNDFLGSLNSISTQMWEYYRKYPVKTRNKFTRALGQVAQDYKFQFQNRHQVDTSIGAPIGIKLIGGDPQLGYMLRNKLFWKDSMDLHHGEHTHSLQWLAIAHGAGTVKDAAELYALTADYRAKSKGAKDYAVTMWQWLADCFPDGFRKELYGDPLNTGETLHSQTCRSPQVITDLIFKSNRGEPIDGHFVSTYLFHRYDNRKWLTRAYSKQKQEETVDYTGDPKGYVKNKMQNLEEKSQPKDWTTSTNSPNRLLHDKTATSERADDPFIQIECTFHTKPGILSFSHH